VGGGGEGTFAASRSAVFLSGASTFLSKASLFAATPCPDYVQISSSSMFFRNLRLFEFQLILA